MSRVEGKVSRVEGKMSRVQKCRLHSGFESRRCPDTGVPKTRGRGAGQKHRKN